MRAAKQTFHIQRGESPAGAPMNFQSGSAWDQRRGAATESAPLSSRRDAETVRGQSSIVAEPFRWCDPRKIARRESSPTSSSTSLGRCGRPVTPTRRYGPSAKWTSRDTGREDILGKIVTLGEVVSDIYRGDEISDVELGFVARPGWARRTSPWPPPVWAPRPPSSAASERTSSGTSSCAHSRPRAWTPPVSAAKPANPDLARVRRDRCRRGPRVHLLPVESGRGRVARARGRH